jgi:hypothetical protein
MVQESTDGRKGGKRKEEMKRDQFRSSDREKNNKNHGIARRPLINLIRTEDGQQNEDEECNQNELDNSIFYFIT